MALSVKMTNAGTIVIRLPKSDLKRAVVNMPDLEEYDDASGDYGWESNDGDAFVWESGNWRRAPEHRRAA